MATLDTDTEGRAFIVGILGGILVFIIIVFCTTKDETYLENLHYNSESDNDSESEYTSDEEDDFEDFIVQRMTESPAFRSKIIRGISQLHALHPTVYAQVMRK